MAHDSLSPLGEATVRWLDDLCGTLRTDVTGLAKAAGVQQSTLSRIRRRETITPQGETLQKLAALAPENVPSIIAQYLRDHFPANAEPAVTNPSLAEFRLPVWGVIAVPRTSEFHLNPVSVSYFRMPASLAMARRVMAFYAPDESMFPRWEMGEPVVVDMFRPAAVGSYALIKLMPEHDPNAEEVYLFRRHDGRSNGVLHLSTASGPRGEMSVPLDRVLEVRQVIAWSDLLM